MASLREDAKLTDLSTPVIGVATHPEGDLVLSTALSGEASFLCTRDKQLLRLRQHQIVSILGPGELLALLEREALT
jgi:predicted nucleic acid-binding protein